MEQSKEKSRRWTKGRILAVALPVCLAVVAAAVILPLTLGKKDEAKDETAGGEAAGYEDILAAYEEISQEAEAATAEMEDLESEEAVSDPEAYEQELEEALTAYEELYEDTDEALQELDELATEYDEVYQEYEELYEYINDYYAELLSYANEALSQVEYLQSMLPTLDELQQLESLAERLANLPASGQAGALSSQMAEKLGAVLTQLENPDIADEMATYGSWLQPLAQELKSLSQQLSQGSASAMAEQLLGAVAQAEQELSAAINALVSGYTSALSQLEAAIQSVPKQ